MCEDYRCFYDTLFFDFACATTAYFNKRTYLLHYEAENDRNKSSVNKKSSQRKHVNDTMQQCSADTQTPSTDVYVTA